jgi:hypothetical protein
MPILRTVIYIDNSIRPWLDEALWARKVEGE